MNRGYNGWLRHYYFVAVATRGGVRRGERRRRLHWRHGRRHEPCGEGGEARHGNGHGGLHGERRGRRLAGGGCGAVHDGVQWRPGASRLGGAVADQREGSSRAGGAPLVAGGGVRRGDREAGDGARAVVRRGGGAVDVPAVAVPRAGGARPARADARRRRGRRVMAMAARGRALRGRRLRRRRRRVPAPRRRAPRCGLRGRPPRSRPRVAVRRRPAAVARRPHGRAVPGVRRAHLGEGRRGAVRGGEQDGDDGDGVCLDRHRRHRRRHRLPRRRRRVHHAGSHRREEPYLHGHQLQEHQRPPHREVEEEVPVTVSRRRRRRRQRQDERAALPGSPRLRHHSRRRVGHAEDQRHRSNPRHRSESKLAGLRRDDQDRRVVERDRAAQGGQERPLPRGERRIRLRRRRVLAAGAVPADQRGGAEIPRAGILVAGARVLQERGRLQPPRRRRRRRVRAIDEVLGAGDLAGEAMGRAEGVGAAGER